MPMPGSVKLSLAALALVVVTLAAAGGLVMAHGHRLPLQLPAAVVLVGLLASAIVRRRRLAWLWGRFLGFFLTFAAGLGVVMQGQRPPLDAFAGLVAAVVLPFLVVSLAFARPATHRWFDLVCRRCGAVATRGDFLMRTVNCPACGERF